MSLNRPRTLLFAGAHPDDETFGAGGTLAQYAAAGVKVYYACATRGEAGSVRPGYLPENATIGEVRWAELKCAAGILRLADVIHLGYRDSGMPGSEDNKHPNALVMAPMEQVVERLVKVIRQVRPDVVITFDPIGGYRHPDHIKMHDATVKAFHAAADAQRYPDAGPAHQPQKLYFHVFPRTWLRVAVRIMPLLGQDPHRFGRNKDIDLASLTQVNFPVNAAVRLTRQAIAARDSATACHASQLDGGPSRLWFIRRLFGERDLYMRGYPPPDGRRRETDLFQGVI
jgi:LmbE family N-acetylglucosaminyl deacetylase